MRILLAIVIANVVVSLSDWYFFGVLWHDKYKAHPEIWRRPHGGPGESKVVGLSALVGALTPTVFVLACALFNMVRPQQALLLGAAVWLMGPVPMWIWNYLFMKMHRLILLAGILGWLVRLGVCALIVVMLLR
ncbi:MAG: hypothetical protein GWN67_02030 [Phycisphaerae bacterium]|nr:hypothetical protein [Phycisphaerae bacterium]NIU55210.1 hypothetical protein [Phycisphaerae bacterium]NIW91888.1 hypothetical protein [Phycisphaerae bacterium]NIX26516.1 hypothetical protein [Phycisphaerae bacterium]